MSKLKVLYVVEDHCDFVLVEGYLQEVKGFYPFEVTHAGTVESALDLLGCDNSPGYDAILANLNLSDSGGRQTYEQLLEGAPTSALIVLSENDKSSGQPPPNWIGAEKFLSRCSIHPDILAQTIVHAVEWKRNESELKKVREELRKTKMQLIQSDKLATLGRLASGVAHEVKNPLGTLVMGVSFINDNPSAPDEQRNEVISEMTNAILRADKIVNEMVDFSRASELNLQPTDLNKLIQRSARLMRHEFTNKSTKLVQKLGENLPFARADADKIEQVLINLFHNAMYSMGTGGTILVRTSLADSSGKYAASGASYGTLEKGAHLEIEVRDYGTGIPEDKIGQVFDAFFTTKPKGEGTGLGLAVAGTIFELHHGAIFLNNEKDPPGLRISLILPVSEMT